MFFFVACFHADLRDANGNSKIIPGMPISEGSSWDPQFR